MAIFKIDYICTIASNYRDFYEKKEETAKIEAKSNREATKILKKQLLDKFLSMDMQENRDKLGVKITNIEEL